MKIWVDDIRHPPENERWVWCKTSEIAVTVLRAFASEPGNRVDLMSLDHDLGGEDTTRPIVIWMIENDFWPVEVKVHSANPVGYEWLTAMIDRYKPTEIKE